MLTDEMLVTYYDRSPSHECNLVSLIAVFGLSLLYRYSFGGFGKFENMMALNPMIICSIPD